MLISRPEWKRLAGRPAGLNLGRGREAAPTRPGHFVVVRGDKRRAGPAAHGGQFACRRRRRRRRVGPRKPLVELWRRPRRLEDFRRSLARLITISRVASHETLWSTFARPSRFGRRRRRQRRRQRLISRGVATTGAADFPKSAGVSRGAIKRRPTSLCEKSGPSSHKVATLRPASLAEAGGDGGGGLSAAPQPTTSSQLAGPASGVCFAICLSARPFACALLAARTGRPAGRRGDKQ